MNIIEKKENNELQKAIVSAVAYFDLFDFPMTDFEIWQALNMKTDLSGVKEALSNIDGLEKKDDFYFLKGRSEIIETRKERRAFYDRKTKRAVKITRLFKFIPWIKMIAVSNIMGANNLKDESDIDLFIITQDKRIWLTRFFCASLAQLLGIRPKKGDMRDKICLNFYVSEEAFNLKNLMMDEGDVYFVYWMLGLVPVYDKGGMYKNFIQANDWIKKYLPNSLFSESNNIEIIKSSFSVLDFLIGWSDGLFKKIQFKLMPKEMKELMNKDTRVVINDKILKMHVNDRREIYRQKYELKIKDYE